MHVTLTRAFQNQKATLGILKIDGINHDPIFTLENPKRITLVDSVIDTGIYSCVPFNGIQFKNVWHVKDVPNRTWILIHAGNTEKDTLGCILLGLGAGSMNNQPCVTNSRLAIEYFRKFVGNNPFTLEVK